MPLRHSDGQSRAASEERREAQEERSGQGTRTNEPHRSARSIKFINRVQTPHPGSSPSWPSSTTPRPAEAAAIVTPAPIRHPTGRHIPWTPAPRAPISKEQTPPPPAYDPSKYHSVPPNWRATRRMPMSRDLTPASGVPVHLTTPITSKRTLPPRVDRHVGPPSTLVATPVVSKLAGGRSDVDNSETLTCDAFRSIPYTTRTFDGLDNAAGPRGTEATPHAGCRSQKATTASQPHRSDMDTAIPRPGIPNLAQSSMVRPISRSDAPEKMCIPTIVIDTVPSHRLTPRSGGVIMSATEGMPESHRTRESGGGMKDRHDDDDEHECDEEEEEEEDQDETDDEEDDEDDEDDGSPSDYGSRKHTVGPRYKNAMSASLSMRQIVLQDEPMGQDDISVTGESASAPLPIIAITPTSDQEYIPRLSSPLELLTPKTFARRKTVPVPGWATSPEATQSGPSPSPPAMSRSGLRIKLFELAGVRKARVEARDDRANHGVEAVKSALAVEGSGLQEHDYGLGNEQREQKGQEQGWEDPKTGASFESRQCRIIAATRVSLGQPTRSRLLRLVPRGGPRELDDAQSEYSVKTPLDPGLGTIGAIHDHRPKRFHARLGSEARSSGAQEDLVTPPLPGRVSGVLRLRDGPMPVKDEDHKKGDEEGERGWATGDMTRVNGIDGLRAVPLGLGLGIQHGHDYPTAVSPQRPLSTGLTGPTNRSVTPPYPKSPTNARTDPTIHSTLSSQQAPAGSLNRAHRPSLHEVRLSDDGAKTADDLLREAAEQRASPEGIDHPYPQADMFRGYSPEREISRLSLERTLQREPPRVGAINDSQPQPPDDDYFESSRMARELDYDIDFAQKRGLRGPRRLKATMTREEIVIDEDVRIDVSVTCVRMTQEEREVALRMREEMMARGMGTRTRGRAEKAGYVDGVEIWNGQQGSGRVRLNENESAARRRREGSASVLLGRSSAQRTGHANGSGLGGDASGNVNVPEGGEQGVWGGYKRARDQFVGEEARQSSQMGQQIRTGAMGSQRPMGPRQMGSMGPLGPIGPMGWMESMMPAMPTSPVGYMGRGDVRPVLPVRYLGAGCVGSTGPTRPMLVRPMMRPGPMMPMEPIAVGHTGPISRPMPMGPLPRPMPVGPVAESMLVRPMMPGPTTMGPIRPVTQHVMRPGFRPGLMYRPETRSWYL